MVLLSKRIIVCIIFVAVLFLLTLSAGFSFAGSEQVGDELVGVNVFVVCLNGVNASGVSNMSRVLEGVLLAARVDKIHYRTGELGWVGAVLADVMEEIPIATKQARTLILYVKGRYHTITLQNP